jgi:hypothetical protein
MYWRPSMLAHSALHAVGSSVFEPLWFDAGEVPG